MNQDDFKKLLEESLKPLQSGLEEVKKDLGELKQDLDEVKNTQENQVLPSVITTETTIKGYADAYKTN